MRAHAREVADRIDDRRRVEQHLEHELPDLSDVAKAHEQRGEDQRDREDPDVQLEHQRKEEEPVPLRHDLLPGDEGRDRDEIDREGDRCRERRRGRDDRYGRTRACAAATRATTSEYIPSIVASLKNVTRHDSEQQRQRVVVRDRAELEDAPEHEVEHREQRERLDQRPDVAERRARVLELEVGRCDDVEDAQTGAQPGRTFAPGAGRSAIPLAALIARLAYRGARLAVARSSGEHRVEERAGSVRIDRRSLRISGSSSTTPAESSSDRRRIPRPAKELAGDHPRRRRRAGAP